MVKLSGKSIGEIIAKNINDLTHAYYIVEREQKEFEIMLETIQQTLSKHGWDMIEDIVYKNLFLE